MKTFREWFNQLDEPYRSQSIRNTTENGLDVDVVKAESIKEALEDGFIWIESDQGHTYWSNLYKEL